MAVKDEHVQKTKQSWNFMKVYLAGMGADDKDLLQTAEKEGYKLRRLISFAYKSDALKLIILKRSKNGKKKTLKRLNRSKTRSSK
jgi:hypothetical protein